jgi:hypothetical protein
MVRRKLGKLAFAYAACALAGVSGCQDLVRDNRVDELGDEDPGVPTGPLHRPGQPCLWCHAGDGPGDSVFSQAGTVYKTSDRLDPLPDAILHFIDSAQREFIVGTNCAGNFFIDERDYAPSYPAWVSIEFGGATIDMSTPIFREGSCAVCHFDPAGRTSTGHVYLVPGPFNFPPTIGCQ